MSYGVAQLKSVLDDMAMLAEQMNPSLTKEGGNVLTIFLRNGKENPEYKEAFEKFRLNYGDQTAEWLLRILGNDSLKSMSADELKSFWERKVYQYLTADGLTDVSVHWIQNCPPVFDSLSSQYRGIYFFLSDDEFYEQLVDVYSDYSPSFGLLAELTGNKSDISQDYLNNFSINAGASLMGLFGARDFVQRKGFAENTNFLDTYAKKAETIKQENATNFNFVSSERQQNRNQGVEKALEFLIEIKKAEQNRSNEAALELAILKGENTFNEITASGKARKQKVSDIIDRNPKEMSALEKLKVVDALRRLKAEQEALEKKLVKKGNRNIEQQNEDRLKLAILRGENFFEKLWVVEGKEFKKKQEISIIIGHDPRKMFPLQRLEAVDNLGKLIAEQEDKQKDSALVWIKEQLEELGHTLKKKPNKTKVADKRDALAEGLAVLENKSTFVSSRPGPDGGAQVRHIVEKEGIDGKKKSKLEQFQSHVEKYKKVFAHKTIKAFVDFIDAMKGLPTFNIGLDCLAQLPALGNNQRVESPSSSNLQPANVSESRKRSRSSDNLDPLAHKRPKQEQPDVPSSKKRKRADSDLSSPNLKYLKLSEAASAGTLFQQKPAEAETTEQEELAKLIPLIPTISTRA